MKKEDLVKASVKVFKAHKNAEVIYATTDGQFFLEKAKNHAQNHAKFVGREVVKITRAESEGKPAPVETSEGSDEPGIESFTIAQLKDVAQLNNIELTGTKRAEILAEVQAGLDKLHNEDKGSAEGGEGSEEE